jgi:hypothetical protein
MKGTIITYPCHGGRVTTTPINGPATLDRLKAAVGAGEVEVVPGFDTIDYAGKVVPCVAFWDKESKLKGQPINRHATILWDAALLRAGYPGLLKPDGQIADLLFGQVAIAFGDAEFMAAPALGHGDDDHTKH